MWCAGEGGGILEAATFGRAALDWPTDKLLVSVVSCSCVGWRLFPVNTGRPGFGIVPRVGYVSLSWEMGHAFLNGSVLKVRVHCSNIPDWSISDIII